MIGLRPMHETLTGLAEDLLELAGVLPISTESVELSLPLDLRLSADGTELAGDLPLFRQRTAFDPEPARLHVVFARSAR